MSRTCFVEFRGDGCWAYDVTSSVFLKFLIEAAIKQSSVTAEAWLDDAISHWRSSAVVSDFDFYLDGDWSPSQVDLVVDLCRIATETIRAGGDLTAADVESCPVLDTQHIFTRGHDPIPAEPVARFGDAVIALLRGTLPRPPENRWWFFTLDEEVDTIPMRTDR